MPEENNYWDTYKELQTEFFTDLQALPPTVTIDAPPFGRFACVYCKLPFDTLKELQFHYRMRGVGEDSTLIPRSIRGSISDWNKNVAAISAPTIKSVS